jgi:Uma2 family endonuclease
MTDQTHTPFWEDMGLPAPGTPITPEEYQQLPETNIHMEIRGGVIVYPHWSKETMSPAPIPDHQDIAGNIYVILKMYQREHGGKTYFSPIDVYLPGRVKAIQPDVLWLAPGSQCVQTDTNLRGAPELIVEVLSPSTAQYDKTVKFNLYQSAGVREYWMADPRDRLIEVHQLVDRIFVRVGAFAEAFTSPLLGAQVGAAAIFPTND